MNPTQTLIALSDSHGSLSALTTILRLEPTATAYLHAGDGQQDLADLFALFPEKEILFYGVAGNNDFGGTLPHEQILSVGSHRLFLVHGHQYGVKRSLTQLVVAAKERRCTLAVYGHTHHPQVAQMGGVLTINPGCSSRALTTTPSYCKITLGKSPIPHIIYF